MKLFILNFNPTGTSGYLKPLLPHPEHTNSHAEYLNCHPELTECNPEFINCHPEFISGFKSKRITKRFRTKFGMANPKAAFTLAEVLITLGIIGVVAAMTIPNLITSYKAHRFRSQFLKSYSTVQQVFKQMEADDVSLDPESYPTRTFYKSFMKYLQAPFDCGTNTENNFKRFLPCYDTKGVKHYKSLDGQSTVGYNWFDDGQIALQNGTLLLIENDTNVNQLWVSVDLNGFNNPPNRWGYDLFTFQFIEGELLTMGDKKTKYNDIEKYCNLKGSGAFNGAACAQLAKTDTDYFKTLLRQKIK